MRGLLYKNFAGNIGILFIVFVAALIVVITLLPPKLSPVVQEPCIVGERPAFQKELVLPGIKDIFVPPDFGGNEPIYGGQDLNEKAEFVLIRSKVPTAKESIPQNWIFLGGKEKSSVEHTTNYGEIPEMPGYDVYYPSRWGEIDLVSGKRIYIRQQGLLVFVKNDPNLVVEKNGKHIYMAEVYQDKRILNNPEKEYKTEELFLCFPDSELQAPRLITPEQRVSDDKKELQLEWLYLEKSNYWGVHCKPAVYLYPPKKMLINVKVKPSGFLTYTDPEYNPETGWNVEAFPDGKLIDQTIGGRRTIYDYLYFESKIRDEVIKKPEKGWVIKSSSGVWFENLEQHFMTILPQLGLNDIQTRDFIEYWKKTLPNSAYYFVGVIDPMNVDEIESLSITPHPDSINRVRIYFEQLDVARKVDAPIIENNPFRIEENRFKVVEWGGMVKNDRDHPFTCSQ